MSWATARNHYEYLDILDRAWAGAGMSRNLRPGGLLVVVNHGLEEVALAAPLCAAVALRPVARFAEPGPFSAHRARPRRQAAARAMGPAVGRAVGEYGKIFVLISNLL